MLLLLFIASCGTPPQKSKKITHNSDPTGPTYSIVDIYVDSPTSAQEYTDPPKVIYEVYENDEKIEENRVDKYINDVELYDFLSGDILEGLYEGLNEFRIEFNTARVSIPFYFIGVDSITGINPIVEKCNINPIKGDEGELEKLHKCLDDRRKK